jgi:hypothetical protein
VPATARVCHGPTAGRELNEHKGDRGHMRTHDVTAGTARSHPAAPESEEP